MVPEIFDNSMRNLNDSLKKVPKQQYDVLKSDVGLSENSSADHMAEKRINKRGLRKDWDFLDLAKKGL